MEENTRKTKDELMKLRRNLQRKILKYQNCRGQRQDKKVMKKDYNFSKNVEISKSQKTKTS
jgi:hypothetical protein